MITTYISNSAAAIAFLGLTILTPGRTQAQVRVDSARQTATLTTPATLPDGNDEAGSAPATLAPIMEGDDEYGVQKILYRRSNPEPISVSLDFGYYYTDNVALVDRGEIDDFFLNSGLHLSYTPQLKGGLFFSTGAGSEIYRYAETDFFDFDLLSLDAGFLYATPQQGTLFDPIFGNLVSYLRYSFYRISEPWEWSGNVFDNHSIVAGFVKTWKISRGQQIYAGANADVSVEASNPAPQRNEYSLFAGYKVKWTPDLESNLIYRTAWYDYQEIDRLDFNQVLSAGLTWKFTDWLSANTSFSATFNNSDRSAFDYNAINTGLSVALQARW